MTKLGMVTTEKTKMIVMPASRILSAISFGVFCRSAPSTRAIIRSRKVEPGSAVTRTLIESEITCVPPVTAERSPPDSRITGADSPVIAASLTEATPSITSPSDGIKSPVSTSTISPLRSLVAGTSVHFVADGSARRLATVSVLARRRVAACALPRPSATASAKLANSTVNQSQRLICRAKPQPPWPLTTSRTNRIVVRLATTSTVNMTGFRTIALGLSLRKASMTAGPRIFGSAKVAAVLDGMISPLEERSGIHRQLLDQGAECERRKEGEAAHDHDHANDQADEDRAIGREGASGSGH